LGGAHERGVAPYFAPPVNTRIDDDAARQKFNDMLKLPPPE
jgi:hypothetical protein